MFHLCGLLHISEHVLISFLIIIKAYYTPIGEGNGTPLQCSCLEKSHG